MTQAELEREMITRGYRIRYRRPDWYYGACVWTYQLDRDAWTGGLRITEPVMAEASASDLLEAWKRHVGAPA